MVQFREIKIRMQLNTQGSILSGIAKIYTLIPNVNENVSEEDIPLV